MHLLKHLAVQVPGLALEPPLFHNWSIALRFELGVNKRAVVYEEQTSYFSDLVTRAETLYRSAFAPTDLAHIASVNRFGREGRFRRSHLRWGPRRGRRSPNIFDIARTRSCGLNRPSGSAIRSLDGVEYTKTFWTEIVPLQIDYTWILAKIARTDFPVGAGFPDDIFFVNITRNLIFHIYDDRGLDLIAADRTTLQPIYESHKDWLLSYDLTRMQQTFEPIPT